MTGQASVVEGWTPSTLAAAFNAHAAATSPCLDPKPTIAARDAALLLEVLASTPTLAEAWDEGFADGKRYAFEGDDGPRFINPYDEAEGGAS